MGGEGKGRREYWEGKVRVDGRIWRGRGTKKWLDVFLRIKGPSVGHFGGLMVALVCTPFLV